MREHKGIKYLVGICGIGVKEVEASATAAIRRCMSAIFLEKSVYECGVFCWFLAEALRGTNAASERQERIKTVRAFLESCGRWN